jgi:5-methylcytosine-specific restriction endonuclease McrA
MASDVQGKHPGPIPKPARREKVIRGIIFRKSDNAWTKTRKRWFHFNLPDQDGYYQCALCPRLVHESEVTLDHIVTRSRDVKLKYDLNNLQATHSKCNLDRGSMTMEAWNKKRGLSV